MMNTKGFTLLEIIIVLALGAILAGVIYIGFNDRSYIEELNIETVTLAAFLRDAQERARTQAEGVSWGVYFENQTGSRDFYALFNGPAYAGTSTRIFLPPRVDFIDPATGTSKSVIFQKLTGRPETPTNIILRLVPTPTETQTIIIGANGTITY